VIPSLEQVSHYIRGPHTVLYEKDEGLTTEGDLIIGYTQSGADSRRHWTITIEVDRAFLLPLSNAGVVALSPLEILHYNIIDPVTLTFEPKEELEKEIDRLEDEKSLLSSVTSQLNGRIRMQVIDLRNLYFVNASQSDL